MISEYVCSFDGSLKHMFGERWPAVETDKNLSLNCMFLNIRVKKAGKNYIACTEIEKQKKSAL